MDWSPGLNKGRRLAGYQHPSTVLPDYRCKKWWAVSSSWHPHFSVAMDSTLIVWTEVNPSFLKLPFKCILSQQWVNYFIQWPWGTRNVSILNHRRLWRQYVSYKHGTASFWRQMIHDAISSCKTLNTEHFLRVLAIHGRDWGQMKVESSLLNMHCDFENGAASWEGTWTDFRGIEKVFSLLLKKDLSSTMLMKRSSGDSHIGELKTPSSTRPSHRSPHWFHFC